MNFISPKNHFSNFSCFFLKGFVINFELPLAMFIFYLLSQLKDKLCQGIIKSHFSHSQWHFFSHLKIHTYQFFAISTFDRVKKTSLSLTLNGRREQPSSSPLNRCAIRDFMSKIQKIISCELLTQIRGGLFTPSEKWEKLSQLNNSIPFGMCTF